jgi:hypothetical protein
MQALRAHDILGSMYFLLQRNTEFAVLTPRPGMLARLSSVAASLADCALSGLMGYGLDRPPEHTCHI